MDLKIRERREALGLTQTELAKKVGKSFRTIQSWERGESYPNAEYVAVLCNVFNVDPNELLGWYIDHPRARPQPQRLDPEHEALLSNYDRCTSERRDMLMQQAMDGAYISQERPERDLPDAREA